MTDILISLVLGIVQGLTEFLPVSSSGHLEIAKFIMGDDSLAESSMLMTVTLHFATALATMWVFRKDIAEIISGLFRPWMSDAQKFSLKIILSMIPAGLIGVLFESQIEQFFHKNILLVCAMLILTGILLFVADKAKSTDREVSWSNALIIGISQAIAILPGISRSGATISTSVLLGVDKEKSARFSFLMVIPLIFGKIAKDLLDGDFASTSTDLTSLGVGFIAAFVTGVFACTWMINIVKASKLTYFAIYCFIVAAIGITYLTVLQ